MAYFPLFLELEGLPCLVVGGGRVAAGKVKALVKAGAKVTVVGRVPVKELRRFARQGKVAWRRRLFRPGDLKGVRLVVAATDDQPVNERVSRLARRRGIPVNVVDQPALCSFIFPAVIRRGKLALAVSTGGASPALAKWIRKDLQARYGSEFGWLLTQAATARKGVFKKVLSPAARKRLFEKALGAYLQTLSAGHHL